MTYRPAAVAAAAVLLVASAAFAQAPQTLGGGTTHVAAQPAAVALADGSLVGPANPLPTRDANGAAAAGFVSLPPGVVSAAGRGIAAVCTGAGSASFVAADGSVIAVPMNVGFNQFGFAVVEVASNPTASCTYTNLK